MIPLPFSPCAKVRQLCPDSFLVALTVAGALFCSSSASAERYTATDIHPERELMITSPAVVDSEAAKYPGPWSFGALMEQLVGAENAGPCVRDWLETWRSTQTINKQEVPARPGIFEKVIQPWQKRDGYHPDPAKPWVPQMQHAPFRLLAIVNRMDLCATSVAGTAKRVEDVWRMRGREKEFEKLMFDDVPLTTLRPGPMRPVLLGYGAFGFPQPNPTPAPSAGEGRFVFGAVDESGAPLDGSWTIILEYELELNKKGDGKGNVRDWARTWHSLSFFELNDPRFGATLQMVTNLFAHGPGVHLAQLRSNEAAFGEGREFRQFTLAGNDLKPDTMSQTPAPIFSDKHSPEQRALNQFVHDHDALIRSGINRVPAELEKRDGTIPLLGGDAIISRGLTAFYWDFNQNVSHEARHLFSLDTCNGCHGGETGCTDGLHIHPRAEGCETLLSTFLRTSPQPLRVSDPDVKGFKFEYQEMQDRAAILAALLEPNDVSTNNALHPILRARLNRAH